jgi:hypothetical protein
MVFAPIFQSKACSIVFRFAFKVLIPPPILRHIRISFVSIKIHFYDVLLYDSDFIVSFVRPEWLPRLALQTRQLWHEGHTCQ